MFSITAGGHDFWDNTDHGSFLYDADGTRAADEDFSAVVLSTWVAEDINETLADEWGRSGLMARANPEEENGIYVAHARKCGPTGNLNNAYTMLQGRNTVGGNTDRNGGQFTNGEDNLLNGGVYNTPIWMALHRREGVYYATWAADNAGTPGTWSPSVQRAGNATSQGEVYVGLIHQSHNITPVINTAMFEHFSVGPFDQDLGEFPVVPSASVTFDALNVYLTAGATEFGTPVDVDWKVQFTGPDQEVPGLLAAVYNEGNTQAMRDAIVANSLGDPDGSVVIPNINWSNGGGIGYPDEFPDVDNSAGERNLFNEAIPSRFLAAEDNYGVQLTGEIHIPSLADRDNNTAIRFHDGNDDYCYLEIDGVVVINDNTRASWNGIDNGGATQATFDASDVKFDDGEWVSIRYAMLEGSGGDHANLTWDALDSPNTSGDDNVTGGYDTTPETYNPTDIADGAQVSFDNDPSDQVPAENFRTVIPGITAEQSGTGQPMNLLLDDQVAPSNRELLVFVNDALVERVSLLPSLASAAFTGYDEATIVLADVGITGGTRDVDVNTLVVTRDGTVITPAITKAGTETSIVDGVPTDPYTNYAYVVTGTTTAATGTVPFTESATIRSFPIREELRAGLGTPPNVTEGWEHMEFDALEVFPEGGIGGGEDAFRICQDVIRDGTPVTAQQPYINHSDPDASPLPFSGDWSADLPIIDDVVGVDDDDAAMYCRTTITIGAGETGDYTFRVRGDDGYGLRIHGATFTSVAGDGNNQIHPGETSSVFFPGATGNSNALAVCNFPTEGDYLVEFFGIEINGEYYQELSWAPGAITTASAGAWALVGDTSGYVSDGSALADIPASVIPALSPTEAGWATQIWYAVDPAVGSIQNTLSFLGNVDEGTAVFASESLTIESVLNHKDGIDVADGGVFPGDAPYPGAPADADNNQIVVIAQARIVAPADGDYTIQVRSDDGFLMRWIDSGDTFSALYGAGTFHPNAPGEAHFPAGTGDSNSRVSTYLTAGEHDLVFTYWEGTGARAYFEVSAAPGVVPDHGSEYELLSATPNATNLYLGTGSEVTDAALITGVNATGTAVTLTWTGGSPTVDVLRSPDLTPESFTKIGESNNGTYTDNSAEVATATEFFYRVQNK